MSKYIPNTDISRAACTPCVTPADVMVAPLIACISFGDFLFCFTTVNSSL